MEQTPLPENQSVGSDDPYAPPAAPLGGTNPFSGWGRAWILACEAGFMALVGLPPSMLGAMAAHRVFHGNWHPSRPCIPMLFGWWTLLWILFGLAAGLLWALGAARFWPLDQVKELSRGKTRIPIYSKAFDWTLEWLLRITREP